MSVRSLVNGREAGTVEIGDRGLQYGDGLFETMAVIDGRVRRLEKHLARLERGCARLALACPPRQLLEEEFDRVAGAEARAVLKLVLTRGTGGRGYRAEPQGGSTRVVSCHSWPDYPPQWHDTGASVRLCTLRLADQPALAGLKHLNRLEQVLARNEWCDPQIAEGLLCDARGSLICGTMSNVFIVRNGELMTPRLERCGVAGTVRETLLGMAPGAGLAAAERELSLEDLDRAEEVFLSNALIGIWPVVRCAERRWPVGAITRRLQAQLG